MLNLIKPYTPSFSKIPASKTEPTVGASTCASGSQIWKGNIGILEAKETKKNSHKTICSISLKEKENKYSIFKVPAIKYTYKIPNNIKIEPHKV